MFVLGIGNCFRKNKTNFVVTKVKINTIESVQEVDGVWFYENDPKRRIVATIRIPIPTLIDTVNSQFVEKNTNEIDMTKLHETFGIQKICELMQTGKAPHYQEAPLRIKRDLSWKDF